MGNASSAANTWDDISQVIVGYNGYDNAANRIQSDKQIREHLVNEINMILSKLDSLPDAANGEDQNRLDELCKSTRRKLITISESLKSPTYGASSFFKDESIPSGRLARVYEFENEMLDDVSSLSEEVDSLGEKSMYKEVFEDYFLHIMDFIDGFNQALFERESLILGDDFMM